MKLAEILIVEDNPADRRMLGLFFDYNHFGNRIHYANNAAEAEQLLEQLTIDLIICDVNLPDESGIALAHKIKQGRHHAIPIVCLSGIADIEVLNLAERASVTAFIEKPLNFDLLQELMQTLKFMYLGIMIDTDEVQS